jgi:pyridoxal phosphate-dependent aminotransferase EpsN
VNPVCYRGAKPVFVDSEPTTGNVDVSLVQDALRQRARQKRLPRAVIVTHLHGCCVDMEALVETCQNYEVPLLEDVTQAIGARCAGKAAGTWGDVAAYSFDTSSVVTCFGGGILAAHRAEWVEKAQFWATQARDAALWYEHSEAGYNYRLSNVLAGIARAQLEVLEERIARRRTIARRYQEALADIPGVTPMVGKCAEQMSHSASCFQIDESKLPLDRDELLTSLALAGIECRPVTKPLHLCSLYSGCEYSGGLVAEQFFRRSICLPSSSQLTEEDQDYIIDAIWQATKAKRGSGIETFA